MPPGFRSGHLGLGEPVEHAVRSFQVRLGPADHPGPVLPLGVRDEHVQRHLPDAHRNGVLRPAGRGRSLGELRSPAACLCRVGAGQHPDRRGVVGRLQVDPTAAELRVERAVQAGAERLVRVDAEPVLHQPVVDRVGDDQQRAAVVRELDGRLEAEGAQRGHPLLARLDLDLSVGVQGDLDRGQRRSVAECALRDQGATGGHRAEQRDQQRRGGTQQAAASDHA